MKAAIVAVGSELLSTERLDTNSLRLAATLERHGVSLVGKSVVGDDEVSIADELARRLAEVDLVLVTGGLGPTEDDRTRAAASRALGIGRTIDEEQVEHMRRLFAHFGRELPPVNLRQAEILDGATVIPNLQGTAPGQHLEVDGSHLALLPGVPREVDAMIASWLEPFLAGLRGEIPARLERRTLRVASLPESDVEERLAPIYERFGRDAVAILASPGESRVISQIHGAETERAATLDAMDAAIREALGPFVFGRERDTLEEVVGRSLGAAGQTLVLAESCTGGMIGERVTRVAGSSAWFLGGVVVYDNALKSELLGVDEAILREHGAVSRATAEAMACGARERLGGTWSIAVTGIAGPGGGSEARPVGTVHLAICGPGEAGSDSITHRHARFPGDRDRVRTLTTQLALDLLRRRLLSVSASPTTEPVTAAPATSEPTTSEPTTDDSILPVTEGARA